MAEREERSAAAAEGAWRYVPEGSRFLTAQGEQQGIQQPAVFVDRDGVLIEDVHFLTTPTQLRVLPGVIQALRALHERFAIVVVTNQSGVARGFLTERQLQDIHRHMALRLMEASAPLDALYVCPHLPDAAVAAYRRACACRKPKPGMLFQAQADWNLDIARSFLVGDKPRDVEAGRTAGVRSILVGGPPPGAGSASPWAQDLLHAASFILGTLSTPRLS